MSWELEATGAQNVLESCGVLVAIDAKAKASFSTGCPPFTSQYVMYDLYGVVCVATVFVEKLLCLCLK